MDTWTTPTLIETQDYNIVMKINIEFMGKSLETLEYIPKSLNVEPETVLKYGVEIPHDIILAHETKHILKRFKDGNYVIVREYIQHRVRILQPIPRKNIL